MTGPRHNPYYSQNAQLQMSKFVDEQLDKGMITNYDPADLPEGALQLAENAVVRYGKTSRRLGFVSITPAKPNSNRPLSLIDFRKNDNSRYQVRVDKANMYSRGAGIWTNIPSAGGATLTGTDFDYTQHTVVRDTLITVNNGVDNIHLVNPAIPQYTDLIAVNPGNYKFKYITGFANRAIFANLAGVAPYRIQWTTDFDLTIIDPALDPSAGWSDLVDSPSDEADFITGIYTVANQILVMRDHSIWLGIRQPIASAPFQFYSVISGLGCDCPNSIQVTALSITWADFRTGRIYNYTPGGAPQSISLPIEMNIFTGMDSPDKIFSCYDTFDNEYLLAIPQAGSTLIKTWRYNFRTQSWANSIDEFSCSLSYIDFAPPSITIGELSGTIGSLVGTIGSLGGTAAAVATLIVGDIDGDLYQENKAAIDDNGVPFTTTIISREYTTPEVDLYIAEIRIDFIATLAGSLSLYYTTNSGITWHLARISNITTLNQPQLLRFVKQIKCRRLAWKLTTTDCLFNILGTEVHVYGGGKSRA